MFRLTKFLAIFVIFSLFSSLTVLSKERVFKEISPILLKNLEIFDQNKEKLKIKEIFLKDKFYLLNFWATWCLPCKKELPDLEKIIELLDRDKITFYIISIDKKNIEEQLLFLKNKNIKKLIPLFDPQMKIFNYLKLRGIPTSMIINEKGYIVKKHEGIIKYETKIINEIKNFIN